MSAYIIFDIEVHDQRGYEEYRRLGAPTLATYGGRFLVRGGEAHTIEGSWSPKRVIVLEFDSISQARAWHQSAEYQAAREIRDRTAHSVGIIVQGT
ncbi:conserved hypothetical protein [Paraburkholderia ribeironis]|uniref:DUF1330 domain-containing protein n=1 Tax=Paraburkholderia ribeironis TaxID=1247936 RepID=A0A1N7RY86_9BURK|nr:DUF1330 domain-containing protein [Paraburkholderia ribeironis]SIT40083.1 conserved hypothetical protein [Paraburkholderia ribeironis]